jgi:hypothetical protein
MIRDAMPLISWHVLVGSFEGRNMKPMFEYQECALEQFDTTQNRINSVIR